MRRTLRQLARALMAHGPLVTVLAASPVGCAPGSPPSAPPALRAPAEVPAPVAAAAAAPLVLVRTLPLPGVEGRLDHLAVDPATQRLFVAALGNDTLEVVDLAAGTATSLGGLAEPQGVLLVPELQRLFVTGGAAGAADAYATDTLARAARVTLRDDPDNIRRDPRTGRVFVGHGSSADGAIGSFDPATLERGPDVPLAGHPESFQLEARGDRLFVNVPSAGHVAVLDRVQGRALGTWPLGNAAGNFPMALDEAHGRLLVGCREPAQLLVLDTASGAVVQALDCIGDADDIFLDPATDRLFVSGGAGAIDVFTRGDGDRWEALARVPTAAGARTCLLDAATRTLYLAVPHRDAQQAEVHVYRIDDAAASAPR